MIAADQPKRSRKKWYRSKTMLFNGAVAALTALEAASGMLQPFLPANAYAMGMVLLAVGNAFLRVVTTEGVGR